MARRVKLEPRLNPFQTEMSEEEPLQLTTHNKHGRPQQQSPPISGVPRPPATSSPYHQISTTTTQMLSPSHHMLSSNRVLSPSHPIPSTHSLSPSHYAIAAAAAAHMREMSEAPPPPTNGQMGSHEVEGNGEELEQEMNHHS